MLMTRSLFQTYQGVKVLVIRSGKSSLIHSLYDVIPMIL